MSAISMPFTTKQIIGVAQVLLVVIGVVFGWQEMKLAVMALFASSGNEPTALRLYILTGPLSVLPASILLAINLRYGALWLLAGSLVSAVAWTVAIADSRQELAGAAQGVFLAHTLPMAGLGIAAVALFAAQARLARRAAESDPDGGDKPLAV